MKILQVNISDTKGGACVVSWNLHRSYLERHHNSFVAVKHKFSKDENVIVMNPEKGRGVWTKFFKNSGSFFDKQKFPMNHKLAALMRYISEPAVMIRKKLGVEEFNFPGFEDLIPEGTQIIHCHILHGNFFDLRILPKLSSKIPVFITLHDAWLLSGHCAHSFDCNLWVTGCTKCPDLTIPVSIERDNAAFNWRRKRNIYKKSKLHVATPCQWLMDKVNLSILKESKLDRKVIPYGVNHLVFKTGDKLEARRTIGIEPDTLVLLFSANGIKRSRWKDYQLMRRAVEIIGEKKLANKVVFLALGEAAPSEYLGNTEIRFMPYRSLPEEVAEFYRASDIYLHGAKADTFPNAVLEAISCGIPVIATAVGGIPEQVKGLSAFGHPSFNHFGIDEATGILTPGGDAESFAAAIEFLALNQAMSAVMASNAARDSRQRFSMDRQIDAYLEWYKVALAEHKN